MYQQRPVSVLNMEQNNARSNTLSTDHRTTSPIINSPPNRTTLGAARVLNFE